MGLPTSPRVVAEVGPGDSLGTGIAALLTGASTYVAVDLIDYAGTVENVEMVGAIRDLLRVRTLVPAPELGSFVGDGEMIFPHDILDDERLDTALLPGRVSAVELAASDVGVEAEGIRIAYSTGQKKTLDLADTADMVFSQAVLEHVDDLESVYSAVSSALHPGGFASHVIDFKSHHFARGWNGHWTFSDREWSLVRGRRRYAINREPLATHLRLIEAAGLDVVNVGRTTRPSKVLRRELAPRFRDLSDEDLETSSAVIQAVKR